MAYASREKPDETLVPKLTKESLKFSARLLVYIGKPLYLFLSYAVIVVLFVLNITGYFARVTLTNFFRYLVSLAYTLFVNLPISLFKLASTEFEKTKGRKAKFFRSLLTRARSTIVSLSKKITLVLGKLIFLLQTGTRFVGVVLRTSRLLTVSLKRRLKYVEPKVKFKVPALKLKLKFVKFISYPPQIKTKRIKPAALAALITFFVFLTAVGVFGWTVIFYELPSPEMLRSRNIEVSTKIYDRNGVLLYKIYKDQNRTPVPLEKIPKHVRLATIAIEDAEFYSHPGISLRGIARAAIRNIRRGELTGGSTITQQLVKNALLTPEKTLARKLREIVLAFRVELTFDKDEILEMYLNEVSYGGTAYGIQEAADYYFDKDVDVLTLAEAALLAGLPRSPTRYSPYGANPGAAFARQKEVLRLMQLNGFISPKQRTSAEEEKIVFAPNLIDIKAPHFVMFVREALVDKYGEEVVEKGGLDVATILDYRVQKMAEEIVAQEVEKLAPLNVGNGAALVVDTQTGEILAMVGSKDYFDTKNDGNVNVVTRPRQPGSAIKVVNYSYALANGYTPATLLSDTPVTFNVQGLTPYTPKNYDGAFRGKLSLRSALAESRNIPAVKVLASYGVGKMVEQGTKMGITTWKNPSNFGLSLTLGGGEVTLLDLAKVYLTLANYGIRPEIVSILSVTNYEGKLLEENDCPGKKKSPLIANVSATESALKTSESAESGCEREQVLDPRIAYILIDILRDNSARSPAFGSNSLLSIAGHPEVAVKTGTSNNLRDNWAIGFNQKYLVAVWVGNNDNSEMSRIASGITGATPIFNKIMSTLLADEENSEWKVPNGLVRLPICELTHSLACEGCFSRMEWFLQENTPTAACNPEYIEYIRKQKEKEPGEDDKMQGEILEEAAHTER